MSEPSEEKNFITQDDTSLQEQSRTPEAVQSAIESEQFVGENHNNNSENVTNLHTLATATNLTHSFNHTRTEPETYHQHPFFNAFMNYNNSVPPLTQHPFAMTTSPHTHIQLNNTIASPIPNIEIPPKYPTFENINDSQLTESPMTNPSFHSNTNEDSDLFKCKIPNTPTFETKEEKRHRKELEKVLRRNEESEWIKNVTQDSIILTKDNNSIQTIGNKQISTINCNLLTKIARKFHGVIPNNKRKKEDILNIIVNTVLSKDFTTGDIDTSKTPKRNTNKNRTRPLTVQTDNTFYRIINTITCEEGRIHFMKTREQSTRIQLDAVDGHISLWEQLHQLFLSDEDDINKINNASELVSYNVKIDSANNFDSLSSADFRLATCHLMHLYRKSRNKYTQSGSHSHYSDFIEGKGFLLYLHNSLLRIGNTNLNNCCYPALSEEAKLTSSNSYGSGRTFTSSSTLSTTSPRKRTTHALNFEEKRKKLEILDSSKLTMQSIIDKNESLQLRVSQEEIIELRDKIFDTKESIFDLKDRIKSCSSTSDQNKYKRQSKHFKKNLKIFESSYERLKEKIPDYESPSSESSSSSSNEYNSDNENSVSTFN